MWQQPSKNHPSPIAFLISDSAPFLCFIEVKIAGVFLKKKTLPTVKCIDLKCITLWFLINVYIWATTTPVNVENITIIPESFLIRFFGQSPSPTDNHWSDFYHCTLDLPVLEIHVNEIRQSVPISIWLLLLNIISVKASVLHVSVICSFLSLSSIPSYKDTAMCLSVSCDGHLDFF